MRQDDEEKKEMTEISQDLIDAGFVYRKPDKNHPKYKECELFLKESFTIDLSYLMLDDEK